MRKFFVVLVSSVALTIGSCEVDSWKMAVNPGFGDAQSFVGVELGLGDVNLVLPIVPLGG